MKNIYARRRRDRRKKKFIDKNRFTENKKELPDLQQRPTMGYYWKGFVDIIQLIKHMKRQPHLFLVTVLVITRIGTAILVI